MDAGRMLREARRRAGLTQRELARRTKVRQPAIAKIESGVVMPRVDTLDRLLAACGEGLEALPRPGIGVDRTLFPELLRMTHGERARRAVQESRAFAAIAGKARRR